MKIRILTILTILLTSITLYAQENTRHFLAMFYNVENLFDTVDSPDTDDAEFLPSSEKQWNTEKYYRKLENLSKVIHSCDSNYVPDIIGLAEVENKAVLKDLSRTLHYKKPVYQSLHEESADPRGIDVALLYNPNRFSVISWKTIPVMSPGSGNEKSRAMLYALGKVPSGDTLHVFVCHWKSRMGGAAQTETQRVFSAMTLKSKCDSILSKQTTANILIMGDFNDDPENKSIFQILQANNKRRNREIFEYFNLHYDIHNFYAAGTLSYDNYWYLFDQMIVSNNLLINSRGIRVRPEAGSILKHEWMLYKPDEKGYIPKPTYSGKEYIGGYSDHLPVFVRFER